MLCHCLWFLIYLTDRLVIFVGDQSYYCGVISKPDDDVGVMCGHAVIGAEGIQKRAEYTSLRGSNVKSETGQHVRKFRFLLHRKIFSPRSVSLGFKCITKID